MRRMTLNAVWSCLAITGVVLASPAARAANVRTEQVTFRSGSETIAGFLAAPDSPGKHPALVVLHDERGLTDWVKGQTRRLAGQGYVALAVDLYRGQIAYDPSYAYELMTNTPNDRALQDMEAAIHYLIVRSDVEKEKVGVIGWSAGGKWALLLATHDPFLTACVSNYGELPTDAAEIQKIRAPVLAIFGADDRYITAADIRDFEAAMDKAHQSIDIKIYPHASSGFENSDNRLDYREGAAEDAWQRTVTFLDQHMK